MSFKMRVTFVELVNVTLFFYVYNESNVIFIHLVMMLLNGRTSAVY